MQLPDHFSQYRKWHEGLFDAALCGSSGGANEANGASEEFFAFDPKGDERFNSSPQLSQDVRGTAVSHECSGLSAIYQQRVDDTAQFEATTQVKSHLGHPPSPLVEEAAGLLPRDPKVSSVTHGARATDRQSDATHDVSRAQDSSFEEDMRVFDALPDYPVAALSAPSPPAGEVAASSTEDSPRLAPTATAPLQQVGSAVMAAETVVSISEAAHEDALPFPSVYQLSTITERIDAEEAELASYLSWLETQQPAQAQVATASTATEQQTLQQPTLVPLPAESVISSNTSAQSRLAAPASGIPRYVANRPAGVSVSASAPAPWVPSIDAYSATETEFAVPRVFSPRDAAMRAEQSDPVRESSGGSRVGKSAFQARPHFGSY